MVFDRLLQIGQQSAKLFLGELSESLYVGSK